MKISILVLLLNYCLFSGELFHRFHETASIPVIDKWNINKDSLPSMYVIEKFNNQNQVIEIRFISNGKVWNTHTAFEVPIIKYSYNGNKIIETYYNNDGSKHSGVETGLPYKTVYLINKDGEIINCEYEFYIAPVYEKDMDSTQIAETIKNLNEGRTCNFVWYYAYSEKKYNGTFPKKKNIKIEDIERQFKE